MEEAMSKFKSVVETEQRNGGLQEKQTLAESEISDSRSNKEHVMDKVIIRQKGVGIHPISVGVDAIAN